MKRLQWLKTKVGLFADPRMMYLLQEKHGDSYVVLWFFLKDMAGTIHDGGAVYIADGVPMTAAFIAKFLRRRRPFIERGLDILERLDLISRGEDGTIYITIWDELQDFDRRQRQQEQTRERVRRYRRRRAEEAASADLLGGVETKADMAEEASLDEAVGSETLTAEGADELSVREDDDESTLTDERAGAEGLSLPVGGEGDRMAAADDLAEGDGSSPAVRRHESLFGYLKEAFSDRLRALEGQWGKDAVLKVIDMAADKGISSIPYIEAVLRHCGGDMDNYREGQGGDGSRPDEYVDAVLENLRREKAARLAVEAAEGALREGEATLLADFSKDW